MHYSFASSTDSQLTSSRYFTTVGKPPSTGGESGPGHFQCYTTGPPFCYLCCHEQPSFPKVSLVVVIGRGPQAGRAIGEGYRYLGIGMQFAGGIVFFTVGGVFLDRWLGLVPLFTIVGTLLGTFLSFVNVYIKLQAFGEADAKRKEAQRR